MKGGDILMVKIVHTPVQIRRPNEEKGGWMVEFAAKYPHSDFADPRWFLTR
jgi:hypothetical protein